MRTAITRIIASLNAYDFMWPYGPIPEVLVQYFCHITHLADICDIFPVINHISRLFHNKTKWANTRSRIILEPVTIIMRIDASKNSVFCVRDVSTYNYRFSPWRYASNQKYGEHRQFHIKIFKITSSYHICTCLPVYGLPQNHNA